MDNREVFGFDSPALRRAWKESKADALTTLEGVGLHTGVRYRVKLRPNPSHRDLHFVVRLPDGNTLEAPALWTRLSGTARATALVLRGAARAKVELKTVEHFLSAALVAGLVSADLEIEAADGRALDTYEMPCLDGSSLPWLDFVQDFQARAGSACRAGTGSRAWKLLRSVEVADGDKRVSLLPLEEGREALTIIHCSVSFPPAWKQEMDFTIDWMNVEESLREYRRLIAPARTFGFKKELDELARRGLALGGTLENALLLDDDRVVNPGGFKLPQELAAHKLLDALGDFALLGGPLLARIVAEKAGHSMHLRALAEAARTGALVSGTIAADGAFIRDL